MREILKIFTLVGFVMVSNLFGACGTTATISRINGQALEAKIVSSDRDYIMVGSTGTDAIKIARSEITDIDHPGNGAAVTGGILAVYGALNIAIGASGCEEEGGGAYCVGVFLPAVVGVPLFIYGMSIWMGSTKAASGKDSISAQPDRASMLIAPMMTRIDDKEFYGAMFTSSF